MPSSDWPVAARICVRPAAEAGSLPAITCARPALSTNTIASSRSAEMGVPAVARSIIERRAPTRVAVASAPPGLLVNSGWALPAVAREAKSASMAGT